MSRGHGERTDRNRACDEEETFVHHDPETQSYSDEQRNTCRIDRFFFVFSHDVSFHSLKEKSLRPPENTLHQLLFSIQILSGVRTAQSLLPGFAVVGSQSHLACRIGHEIFAGHSRSRPGDRHFPEPGDRSRCAEKSPWARFRRAAAIHAAAKGRPRVEEAGIGDRRSGRDRGFGLASGASCSGSAGCWPIPSGLDWSPSSLFAATGAGPMGPRLVASGACRCGEPGPVRERHPTVETIVLAEVKATEASRVWRSCGTWKPRRP